MTFRTPHADARRRLTGLGARRRRRPVGGHPAGIRCRGRAASSTVDDFGTRSTTSCRTPCSLLLPVLGVVIVLAVGALAGKPATGGRRPRVTARRSCSPFFGLGMIFVGMIGGALLPITDLGLHGTVFEEGALVVRRLRHRARRPRRHRLLGAEVDGAHDRRAAGARSRRRSACSPPCWPRCRTTSPASPTSRRRRGVYDYDGPAELWNVLVADRPRPDARSSSWPSPACWLRSLPRRRRRGAATTRGTARRSSGRRRRRRPPTTSSRCRP